MQTPHSLTHGLALGLRSWLRLRNLQPSWLCFSPCLLSLVLWRGREPTRVIASYKNYILEGVSGCSVAPFSLY